MRVLACPGCGTRVGVPEGAAPYCPKCGFGREDAKKREAPAEERSEALPPGPATAAAPSTDGSRAKPAPSKRQAPPMTGRQTSRAAQHPAASTATAPRRPSRLRVPRRKGKGLVLADPYEDVEDGPGFAVAVGVAVGAGVLAVVGAYYFWVLV